MSSPEYRRWRAGHRGVKPGAGNTYRKRVHRWRVGAWWHLLRLRWRYPKDKQPMAAYSCRWTDDVRQGETGRRHWHVGRANKWAKGA